MGFFDDFDDSDSSKKEKQDEKERTIDTSELRIDGHLFRFGDETIQISNIGSMNTSKLPLPEFPGKAIVAFVVALVMFSDSNTAVIAVAPAVLGFIWIRAWLKDMRIAKEGAFLNITMNSGARYAILFRNKEYIRKFRSKFDSIFADDGAKPINATFDMRSGNFLDHSPVSNSTMTGVVNK